MASSDNGLWMYVAFGLMAAVALLAITLLTVCCVYCRRRRRRRRARWQHGNQDIQAACVKPYASSTTMSYNEKIENGGVVIPESRSSLSESLFAMKSFDVEPPPGTKLGICTPKVGPMDTNADATADGADKTEYPIIVSQAQAAHARLADTASGGGGGGGGIVTVTNGDAGSNTNTNTGSAPLALSRRGTAASTSSSTAPLLSPTAGAGAAGGGGCSAPRTSRADLNEMAHILPGALDVLEEIEAGHVPGPDYLTQRAGKHPSANTAPVTGKAGGGLQVCREADENDQPLFSFDQTPAAKALTAAQASESSPLSPGTPTSVRRLAHAQQGTASGVGADPQLTPTSARRGHVRQPALSTPELERLANAPVKPSDLLPLVTSTPMPAQSGAGGSKAPTAISSHIPEQLLGASVKPAKAISRSPMPNRRAQQQLGVRSDSPTGNVDKVKIRSRAGSLSVPGIAPHDAQMSSFGSEQAINGSTRNGVSAADIQKSLLSSVTALSAGLPRKPLTLYPDDHRSPSTLSPLVRDKSNNNLQAALFPSPESAPQTSPGVRSPLTQPPGEKGLGGASVQQKPAISRVPPLVDGFLDKLMPNSTSSSNSSRQEAATRKAEGSPLLSPASCSLTTQSPGATRKTPSRQPSDVLPSPRPLLRQQHTGDASVSDITTTAAGPSGGGGGGDMDHHDNDDDDPFNPYMLPSDELAEFAGMAQEHIYEVIRSRRESLHGKYPSRGAWKAHTSSKHPKSSSTTSTSTEGAISTGSPAVVESGDRSAAAAASKSAVSRDQYRASTLYDQVPVSPSTTGATAAVAAAAPLTVGHMLRLERASASGVANNAQ
ncbi:mucin-5AC-like isoform X2 [Sycon ciliatum]|uniref:mucin-5AC-like isoform X2 n=1 Tax=Sycon ciliatum TaxID=27933 RepID=UPI0031F5F972